MSPAKTQLGITRDCKHTRVRHEHGHHTTYRHDKCGCPPCTGAYRRWRKARDLAAHRGVVVRVDPARARGHVEALLAAGVTVSQIQNRSGVNRSTIRTLVGVFPNRPALGKISPLTESRLLAVHGDLVGDEEHGIIRSTGTSRRLQALVANGWPQVVLARQLGRKLQHVRPAIHGEKPIYMATYRSVVKLYDRLWDQPPPTSTGAQVRSASRARTYARTRGWVPPLAWDDDTIDDPAAVPAHDATDGVRPDRLIHADEVFFLAEAGLYRDEIADKLHVSPRSLQTVLERHEGGRDLWLRLVDREQVRRLSTHNERSAAA